MQLKKVKNASELPSIGLKAEFVRHDGTLKEVRLSDDNGADIRIKEDGYSTFGVFIPEPPEIKHCWRLSGTYNGLVDIDELHETKFDAEERLRKLGVDGLQIEEVDVEVDPNADAGDTMPDIPF